MMDLNIFVHPVFLLSMTPDLRLTTGYLPQPGLEGAGGAQRVSDKFEAALGPAGY